MDLNSFPPSSSILGWQIRERTRKVYVNINHGLWEISWQLRVLPSYRRLWSDRKQTRSHPCLHTSLVHISSRKLKSLSLMSYSKKPLLIFEYVPSLKDLWTCFDRVRSLNVDEHVQSLNMFVHSSNMFVGCSIPIEHVRPMSSSPIHSTRLSRVLL